MQAAVSGQYFLEKGLAEQYPTVFLIFLQSTVFALVVLFHLFLCLRQHLKTVPEAFSIDICPSVSE